MPPLGTPRRLLRGVKRVHASAEVQLPVVYRTGCLPGEQVEHKTRMHWSAKFCAAVLLWESGTA